MTSQGPGGQVIRTQRLQPDDLRQVHDLAALADRSDGAAPLSEEALLRLRATDSVDGVHLLLRLADNALAGYAYVAGAADARTVELVVHPASRRHGLGRALAAAALAAAGPVGPVLAWAHGDHPSAAALALDLGFERARVLWQLRRPLGAPLPEPELPAGVTLRAFRPGEDDEAWLDVNRRAFATHPEQGRWTAADLRLRMAQPWFDPAGFLLAVDGTTGRILGFHWTKVHGQPGQASPVPVGEVYVLGVDPGAHRSGLGRALTVAGLNHLAGLGLDRVMLYVDESNAAAVALYLRSGFAHWTAHVQYRLV